MSPQLDGEEIEAVVRVRACPGFDRVHLAMAIGRVLNSLQASGDIARGYSVGTSSVPAKRHAEGRRKSAVDPADDAEDTGSGEGRDTAAAADERMWGRCPRCLKPRPGNEDPRMGLSFAPPCEHCGHDFIPEHEPRHHVLVCPYCLRQERGNNAHERGNGHGLGRASCWHVTADGRHVTAELVRVEVQLVDFTPRSLDATN